MLTTKDNADSGLHYHEDSEGRIISITPCTCLPTPPSSSGLEVRSLILDCRRNTSSSYAMECSVDGCGSDVWPSCQDNTEQLITSQKDLTWEYTACQEVHIDYLNKSISCGVDGWKTSTLRQMIGNGIFTSVSEPIPCQDCDEKAFEWTPWASNGQTSSIRTRGRANILDSSQTEEKPGKCIYCGKIKNVMLQMGQPHLLPV